MKRSILVFSLWLFAFGVQAQEIRHAATNLNQPYTLTVIEVDSIENIICLKRGHIVVIGMVTSAYCPPYTIDTDSTSILVYPACNSITGTCERCNKEVTQMEKEERLIIWKNKSNITWKNKPK